MSDVADPIDRARTEFERAMQRNIKGLGYFSSPSPVLGATAKDTLISRGTLRLYHYRPLVDDVYRVPLLLVMATTNRGYIFDMVPGQSFVAFLLGQGYDVFMVDWEAPGHEERNLSMEDYVLDFLPSSVARVQQETGERDITMIGYCFGGVLSLLWAALHRDAGMKNLVTFTTPINFKAMQAFQAWSDKRFFDVDQVVETFGNCPAEMLYTAFSMLRPGGQVAGNIRLWDNMWNDEFVKSYRMFDRWAVDMLPLAGEYFRQTTKQLMWDNALYEGQMTVGGARDRPVDHHRAVHACYCRARPYRDVGGVGTADQHDRFGGQGAGRVERRSCQPRRRRKRRATIMATDRCVAGSTKRLKTITINDHAIVIRAFERGDAVPVGAFAAALPAHDLLFLSRDIQHARVIEAWAQSIADGAIESLVALDGDAVIATTAIVRDPLGWSPHVAEIRLLVHPAWRSKGLGRMLLDGTIALATERGALKLIARMTPDQRGAIALFEESGFRGEAMLRDHVRNREGETFDLAIMSLDVRRARNTQAAWGFEERTSAK